jgi:Zn-finger nucleic acid-binding protein
MPEVTLGACSQCQGFWVRSEAFTRIAAILTGAAAAPAAASASQPPAAGVARAAPVEHGPAHASRGSEPGRGPASEPRPAAGVKSKQCPKCQQPNAVNAAVCWACGQILQVLQGPATGTCPRCEGTLHRLRSENAEVSICNSCGGAWLGRGMLSALQLQTPAMQDVLLEKVARLRGGQSKRFNSALICPHCDVVMLVAPMGMVTRRPVRVCSRCASYFMDYGLLEEILVRDRL